MHSTRSDHLNAQQPRPRLLPLLLSIGLAIGGCGSEPESTLDGAPGSAASGATTVETGIVRGLSPGDRACYVAVEGTSGSTRNEEASFELCESTGLIGQQVRLTRARSEILARSCEGDPDCSQHDTTDLIVEMEPLDPR